MIEIATRLRGARGFGKTEGVASEEALRQLQRRGHPEQPPALCSDGCGGIREALVEVYGQVPSYQGRGRPPERKRPVAGWQYLQLVKQRDARGRHTGTKPRVVFGEQEAVQALFGGATAYVERTHLTMRHMNSRLVRKGLGFSKLLAAHRWAAAWEDALYNLVRPLKTLREEVTPTAVRFRQRWRARTPAMAAGLTDHVWSVKELLRLIPIPLNNT